jgi:hypothetical protein
MLNTLICLAVILYIKMAAVTKLGNYINAALNGLLDPENMSLDIKIMSICASHAEI